MNSLVVLPVVLPLATAVLTRILPKGSGMLRLSSLGSALGLLAAAVALLSEVWRNGIQATQLGDWPAPFGITLVADHLAAAMVAVTAVVGVATVVYSFADLGTQSLAEGFHPSLHALLAGVCGAFLAGDIFNLYVWFEVMLISSFALLALGGTKAQLDAAVRYAALNLLATILLLTGIGLLYGLTGTLNMADLHLRVQDVANQGLLTVVAIVFIAAFGIKSAVFPLFFWLPASYHTPKVCVSAVFSGLLTKVGVYSLMRVFTLIFAHDAGYTHQMLVWIAGLTMVTGVLGAAAQYELRRILSFHIISQIGYMVLGVALLTPLGLVGGIFYILHHIIVKTNLFFVAGAARRIGGSAELRSLGGLYKEAPLLAVLFFVPAFSLAGFPPLSGFWAKFLLIEASLEAGRPVIAAVALAVGLLTAYSMTKIWVYGFWKPRPPGVAKPARLAPAKRRMLLAPIAGLAALTLSIGLFVQPLYSLAERAAAELVDPTDYVRAVLGASGSEELAGGAGPAGGAP